MIRVIYTSLPSKDNGTWTARWIKCMNYYLLEFPVRGGNSWGNWGHCRRSLAPDCVAPPHLPPSPLFFFFFLLLLFLSFLFPTFIFFVSIHYFFFGASSATHNNTHARHSDDSEGIRVVSPFSLFVSFFCSNIPHSLRD